VKYDDWRSAMPPGVRGEGKCCEFVLRSKKKKKLITRFKRVDDLHLDRGIELTMRLRLMQPFVEVIEAL
jgi:hypothetical protein